VATYHHLKGREDQLKAFRELNRVLKPEAEAFLTVWNRCQTRFWFKGKEVSVPWRVKGQIVDRYYYLFTYCELEGLVKEAGFDILRSFPESSYHFPCKYIFPAILFTGEKEKLQLIVQSDYLNGRLSSIVV
jgi:SAM-dependent methyltransferase